MVRRAEADQGIRGGMSTSDRERLKELERENRELKRANEILRKASAYFAQVELDRRSKWWRYLSISIENSMGSSQSIDKYRLLRRVIMNTKGASGIRINCPIALSETWSWRPKYNGFGKATSGFMTLVKYGGNCCGKALMLLAVRLSGWWRSLIYRAPGAAGSVGRPLRMIRLYRPTGNLRQPGQINCEWQTSHVLQRGRNLFMRLL